MIFSQTDWNKRHAFHSHVTIQFNLQSPYLFSSRRNYVRTSICISKASKWFFWLLWIPIWISHAFAANADRYPFRWHINPFATARALLRFMWTSTHVSCVIFGNSLYHSRGKSLWWWIDQHIISYFIPNLDYSRIYVCVDVINSKYILQNFHFVPFPWKIFNLNHNFGFGWFIIGGKSI